MLNIQKLQVFPVSLFLLAKIKHFFKLKIFEFSAAEMWPSHKVAFRFSRVHTVFQELYIKNSKIVNLRYKHITYDVCFLLKKILFHKFMYLKKKILLYIIFWSSFAYVGKKFFNT